MLELGIELPGNSHELNEDAGANVHSGAGVNTVVSGITSGAVDDGRAERLDL